MHSAKHKTDFVCMKRTSPHTYIYRHRHTYTCMNYKSKVKGIQLVSCVGPLATVLHSSSEWSFSPLAFSVRMMPCDAFSRSKHISFCSIPQIQGISFICYTLYPFKMCEKGYIRFIEVLYRMMNISLGHVCLYLTVSKHFFVKILSCRESFSQ